MSDLAVIPATTSRTGSSSFANSVATSTTSSPATQSGPSPTQPLLPSAQWVPPPPAAISAVATLPTPDFLSRIGDKELRSLLRVGDLLAVTLSNYRLFVFEECETSSWEETWDRWVQEEDPASLTSPTGQFLRTAIRNSMKSKKVTDEHVSKELVFFGKCLELFVVRCTAAHDGVLEKQPQELFSWLKETEQMLQSGELAFPTQDSKGTVLEAVQRQRQYHFKRKKGAWWSKGHGSVEVF